jgi:hypothetical protein
MKLILKEVRRAPKIHLNLISTGKLDDGSYCNVSNEGQWKLPKGFLIVVRGNKSCNLYILQASIYVSFENAIKSVNICELWQKRLSHISEKGLDCLREKKLLLGL